MADKGVIATEEYLAKIMAAVDARVDPEFTIMARTDALAIHGMDEALERLHRAIELGANAAFVEAPRTREEMRLAASLPVPTLVNIHLAGRTPVLPAVELQALGFAIATYPAVQSMAIARHLTGVMRELLKRGDLNDVAGDMLTFDEFTDLLGLPDLRDREARYAKAVREFKGPMASTR
jgi:methylisocitrate lyase